MVKRVVVDANVFVSALLRKDTAPRQIIRLCLLGKIQPLMGMALFAEYEAVMNRSEIEKKSILSKKERTALLDALFHVCQWVPIYYLWRPNLRDEADNHMMELAVAGNACAIITGNTKDLEQGELLFPNIHILTPKEFIKTREESWQH